MLNFHRWMTGEALTENEEDLIQQFGFFMPDETGVLRPTESGRQALRDNGLSI